MKTPIRVLLAEDQLLVRQGIAGLLSLTDEITIASQASDGKEAIAEIKKVVPDVILMDIRMPKYTGIEVLEYFNKLDDFVLPPTILLTTFDDDEAFLKGIKAGAKGFLLKNVSLEQLTGSILAVAGGDTAFRPGLTERIIQTLRKKNSLDNLISEKLTQREVQVLRLIGGGYSNKEISDLLKISEGVVKNYTSSIFSKTGARDRTNAVLKAIELGYI